MARTGLRLSWTRAVSILSTSQLALKIKKPSTTGGAYGNQYGGDVIFAVPSLSEKGYLDVRIELTAKGGHSSVPPKHTVRVLTHPPLRTHINMPPYRPSACSPP